MSKKILYLYAELVGYQVPVFTTLAAEYQAEVHVISWDKRKLKPYTPPAIPGVTYYRRSEYTNVAMLDLCRMISPDIIYICGWMDSGYMKVARHFRKQGIKVVIAFDDKWKGNMRQRTGSIYFRLFLKKYYSHAWVSGPLQHEYAKRFGFSNQHIIYDMLTGDTELFGQAAKAVAAKRLSYPKAFLYVGNFRHVKGTDVLVKAFRMYREQLNGSWKLICAGNGDYRNMLDAPGIEVIDFCEQEKLVDLAKRSGAFILPSRHEQWGVVVHEFAAAGLPLILSNIVGSKPVFFVENFNGISYPSESTTLLAEAMLKMSSKPDEELARMGENSNLLAARISPKTSAANFMSLLN